MRKTLLIVAFLCAHSLCAQTVTITGTVKDSNGSLYQNGSGTAILVPQNVNWTINQTNPVPSVQVVASLDSFGHFSMSLTNTALIDQQTANPKWQLNFCSVAYNPQGRICFSTTPIPLTSSQDLTATIQPQAAILPLNTNGNAFIVVPETCSSTMTFQLGGGNPTLNTAFNTLLNCSVTTSTVTSAGPSVTVGTIAQFTFQQDGVGGRSFSWPSNFSDQPSIQQGAGQYTNASFWFDGALWHQQIAPASGGGGSSAAGPVGTVQTTNGTGTLTPSGSVDNGTTLNVSRDVHPKGPNPYTDVTMYGVRGINANFVPAVPGMTATISLGSPSTATVSTSVCGLQTGNVCFVNGDGVIVVGAGPANSMSTPGTPTVTPFIARSGTGTEDGVAGPAGSTTYQYQVVARDKNGGLTPASTAGTTSTGQASLGSQSVAIASATCSGTTVTVTTSSAHTMNPGAQIMISVASGGNSCIQGIGTYQVASSADNTHFTYSQGISTANGGATSFSGTATVYWMNYNKVTWAAVTGAWQYYVYGRTSGSMTLLGVTHPSTSVANDLEFDDFGTTMMASSTVGIPTYVPTSPPVSALADPLITRITAGAGTTTLTLANAVSTAVTNSTILFTNGPNILTAAAAANNLYWPIGGSYVVNSFTDVTTVGGGFGSWMYAGGLVLNETLSFAGKWVGDSPNATVGNSTASFNFIGEPVVTTNANPGVYYQPASGFMDRLAFVGGQNPMLIDPNGVPSGPQFGQHMYFATNASLTDYMGIALYLRGIPAAAAVNGMRAGRINIQTGPGQQGGGFTGSTFTPSVYMSDIGSVSIDALFMQDRGALIRPDFAGGSFKLNWGYTQGGITPFVTASGQPTTGNSTGIIEIQHLIDDTTFQPFVSYLPGAFALTANVIVGSIDGVPGGGTGIITGPTASWFVNGTTSGQNTNAIAGANFTDNIVYVTGTGGIGSLIPVPAAPTLSISGASGPAAGTYYYSLLANDTFGNSSIAGPVSSGQTVNGSQGVLVTFPAGPAGEVTWTVCRSQIAGQVGVCASVGAGFKVTGASFLDNGAFFPNNSPPGVTRALASGVGPSGMETQSLALTGGGFASTETGTFTASRTLTRPDLTGTMGVLTAGCSSSNFLGGDNVCRPGAGVNIQTNSTNNLTQTTLNMQTSTVNAIGGTVTPTNPSGGIETYELTGRIVPFGGGTGLSSPAAHSLLVTEGAANMNLVTSPAVNGFYSCGFSVVASAAVDPTCSLQGVPVNTPSTPYTGIYSDRATYQRLTGGSTFSFTLPQVTGNTASNFPFVVQNSNSGLLTLTANGADKIDNSVVGGASTLLPSFAAFVYQDSSSAPGNWWTIKLPTFAAFGSTCANILSWSTSSGFSCVNATGSMFANFPAHTFLGNNTGGSAVAAADLIGASDTGPNAYVAGGGTAQAQTANFTPAVTALTVGLEVDFLPVAANTGAAPTLNVNGLGAVSITKLGSSAALVANDLTTNAIAKVIYDGTEWQLLNPQTTSGSSVPCTATANALQYNNAGAFGCTNFTYASSTTITAAAGSILDLSAATGANAFKTPVQAGCTAGADGDQCYDSTNKNGHVRANGADAINLAIPSAPTTGDLADYTVASGNVLAHDSGVATANVVTAASAAASSKQVCLSGGANKTCSYITFPDTKYAPAANCVNAVAGSGWSTGATPAALCRAGTNNKTGLLSPWGASDVGYIQFHIPADADLTTQLPSLMLEVTTTESSTHTIIMQESVACAKEDGSTTDDVAFNAARSFATVTETTRANQVFDTTITLNSTDLTGCAAPGILWVKVSRTTDTATNVGVYGLSLTTYRLLTVQPN